jgi:hypothetical protein
MTEITQESKPHATKSASGSKRWATCVGSIALVGTLPLAMKRKSSWYADQGSVAHGILEHCLLENEHPEAFLDSSADYDDTDGLRIYRGEPDKGQFAVDQDMVDAVTRGYEYVTTRLAEVKDLNPDAEVQAEAVVDLSWLRPEMFGTCDVSIDDFDLLEVMDYKHGAGVTVEADDNYQGRYYALGRAKEYGFRHKRVRITIIQPRAPHSEGGIRSEELTMEELRAWGEWLGERADLVDQATEEYNDPCLDFDAWASKYLVAGEHCTFCDAKVFNPKTKQLICPAIQKGLYEAANADFDLDDPETFNPEDTFDITPEALSRAAKWTKVLDKWNKTVQEMVENALMTGEDIPGYKVVKKKSNRAFTDDMDEKKILASIIEHGGPKLTKDVEDKFFTPKKLRTLAQLEKLVPAKNRPAWSDAVSYKPDTGLTIATEDDPRPAQRVDASADFEEAEADGEF